MAALDAASTSKILVVVGGPGWGKTTAVVAWMARRRSTWLSVGPVHASVERLSRDLLRALRHRLPGLPAELVTTTAYGDDHDGPTRVEAIVGLIGGLLDVYLDEELVLVVDDLHELPPGSDGARLIEGLCKRSPAHLRLVLVTRQGVPFAPVARVIDTEHLAFTPQEVAALVRPEHAGSVESIWSRTAGWPAAVFLYLEALNSGRKLTPDRLGRSGDLVLADLAGEVVAGETESIRALLRTVALLDKVTAALCTALGHGDAAPVLAELVRRGLLTTANGDQSAWSVPEPIRDVLVGGLDPVDEVPAIRRQAAVFCERVGQHAEALRHLVAAELWDDVAKLLLRRDEQIVAGGDVAAVQDAVDKLRIDHTSDPRLYLVQGYARQLRGDWLGALDSYRPAVGDGAVHACMAWRMGQLYYLTGQIERAVELFGRTERVEPATLDEVRLLSLASRWFRETGDPEQAKALAVRSAAAAEQCGGHTAQALSLRALGLLAAYDGDPVGRDRHYGKALDHALRADHQLLQLTIRADRAWLMVEENYPAEALREIDDAMRVAQQAGLTGYEPTVLSIRARALAKLGRFDEALADAATGQTLSGGVSAARDAVLGLLVRGEVHRRRGQPGQAQAYLDEALHLVDGIGIANPIYVLALASLARVRAVDDLVAARALAETALERSASLALCRVQALLSRGWVALLAGDRHVARADAIAARAIAGQRRDRAGLADSLQLAALSAADGRSA
ncbi:MAG: hypothetical protein ABIQ18_46590, partial [Umezawaea sp.]